MIFEDFTTARMVFLWGGFFIAFIMGAAINKTNFCTMGAISDWVNMGDKGRLCSWILAIAVSTIFTTIFEFIDTIQLSSTFPPYRGNNLILGENILGGLLFGVGMTLAGGCANKNLVRIGGGNLKSVVVITVIGIVAYFMIFPFPGTSQTIYSMLFYDWIRNLSIGLSTPQDLGGMIGGESPQMARFIMGLLVGLVLLALAMCSRRLRSSLGHWLSGLVIGTSVFAAWLLTSSVTVATEDGVYSLINYMNEWDMLADSDEGKPFESRSLAAQSFTFINPSAYLLGFLTAGAADEYMVFGVMALFGVIAGSFLMALINKSFRIEWFFNFKDFMTHVLGAIFMAIGAVLAIGCTVGQSITGFSTLALGSMVTTMSIALACALTIKTQYYQIIYEKEASFFAALVSAMVDLRLLPSTLRQLDKV